jgi:hypothetical protein
MHTSKRGSTWKELTMARRQPEKLPEKTPPRTDPRTDLLAGRCAPPPGQDYPAQGTFNGLGLGPDGLGRPNDGREESRSVPRNDPPLEHDDRPAEGTRVDPPRHPSGRFKEGG